MRPGRPRKYHDDVTLPDRLVSRVRRGMSFDGAARACGVPGTTWARWRRQERAGDKELVAIFDRLRRARAAWQQAGTGMSDAEWEADPQWRAFFASLDRAAR